MIALLAVSPTAVLLNALSGCLRAPPPPRRSIILQESWRQADTATVWGRPRTPTLDGGVDGDDDYAVLDLEVSLRAGRAVKSRHGELFKEYKNSPLPWEEAVAKA